MTDRPQITPHVSAEAVRASNNIEVDRVGQAIQSVTATFAAIGKATPQTVAAVLAEQRVMVKKVVTNFWDPRDSLLKRDGFEYRLSEWQGNGPLSATEVRQLINDLFPRLDTLVSGFGHVGVRQEGTELVVTLTQGHVPAQFRPDR